MSGVTGVPFFGLSVVLVNLTGLLRKVLDSAWYSSTEMTSSDFMTSFKSVLLEQIEVIIPCFHKSVFFEQA